MRLYPATASCSNWSSAIFTGSTGLFLTYVISGGLVLHGVKIILDELQMHGYALNMN
nr:MAG TPA: hypothetical protein [Caudoviricetes sp.]